MTGYAAVLTVNYPGAEWTLNGDSYDGLTWLSDSPKPSQAELDAAWPAIQYQQDIDRIRKVRADLYQSETDGMFFEAMREEGTVTLQDWKDAVQAIKDAHPWPEAP